MPRYLFTHVIALLLTMTGWLIATGGTFITYRYLNKNTLMTMLPGSIKPYLLHLPDWFFLTPSVVVLLLGLIILGLGHLLLIGVENARFSSESSQLLDMVRVRGL